MRKLLIALALCMGVQTQADAQFLKKLGDALEKGAKKLDQATDALNRAVGGDQAQSTATNEQEKLISSVKVGSTTVAAYGDLQGMDINWIGAFRIYGSTDVSLRYQHVNTSGVRLSAATGEANGQAYVVDAQGQRYSAAHVYMGGLGMNYCNSCIIAPGTKDLAILTFNGLPTNVTSLQSAHFGTVVGRVDENTAGHHGSYRITDIPITILPAVTAKGIFGQQKVLIAQTIASLPKAFPYVYDAYTVSTEEDEGETTTIVTFTLNGQETMTAISNDSKTIANIDIRTPNISALVKQTYYNCGSKFGPLKSEYGTTHNDDYNQISWQGIFFDEDNQGNICTIHI